MNILMLSSSYPKFAGDVTAPFIEALARGAVARGDTVTVVLPENRGLQRPMSDYDGRLRLVTYPYVPVARWQAWGYAASLEGDVRLRPVVYLLLPLVIVSSLWRLWRLTGREHFDLIQAHWVIPNAPVAALVAWLRGIPLVISMHGSDVYVAQKLLPARWAARWAFGRCKGATASSPDLMQRAQAYLNAPTSNAAVIPYGVDPAMFSVPTADERAAIRQSLGIAADEKLLFAIGRLVYKKGFAYLIQAMPAIIEAVPDARLLIAGKGDLHNELAAQISTLPPQLAARVTLIGSVAHDRVRDYLAACDSFVLPSVIDKQGNVDGLPNVLLEAMATGAAVVASDVAGVPLAVRDGQSGLLVPPGDVAALAIAIVRVLSDDRLHHEIGQGARRRVEDELNWQTTSTRYDAVFRAATRIAP